MEIQDIYVSSFSWKDAKAKYVSQEFNHRDSGFVNNDMVSITNPVDAARRALKEYPKLGDYLSLDVSHDDESHMCASPSRATTTTRPHTNTGISTWTTTA